MIKVNESTLKRFASRLKFARRKNKMSQTELGEQIGRVQQEIYRLEHGTTYPDRDELEKIAKILSVNPDWLSGESKQKCEYRIHENDDFVEIKIKLYKSECNKNIDSMRENVMFNVNRQPSKFQNYLYNILDVVTSSNSFEIDKETEKTYSEWGRIVK